MKRIRKWFFLALLTALTVVGLRYRVDIVAATARWATFSFCDRPIRYKIDRIDPQFNITQDSLLQRLSIAAEIWNSAAKKTLFEYDENGKLGISLIYDGRQQLVENINDTNNVVEDQKLTLEQESQSYDRQKVELETEIKQLNDKIDYWNRKGGAPREEYDQLIKSQKNLQNRIVELNNFAQKLNQNVEKVNQNVNTLNSNVSTFNSLLKISPEMGTYTSGVNKIEIYFYGSKEELEHVLAHELGHSLGLGHVQETNAIMNPTASSSIKLTQADISEVIALCENKNRLDLIANDLYNSLYTVIGRLQILLTK